MPTYRVYGVVTGTKYLGTYEADTPKDAEELAYANSHVCLCHQCSDEIDDPEIHEIQVEEEK